MSNFKINTNTIESLENDFYKYVIDINNYNSDAQKILKELRTIDSFGFTDDRGISQQLDEDAELMDLFGEALGRINARYLAAEKKFVEVSVDKVVTDTKKGDDAGDKGKSNDEALKRVLNNIKGLVKWAKQLSDDKGEQKEYGVLGGLISYLMGLYDFCSGEKKGTEGLKDWYKLVDKSCGLWDKLYELAKFKTGVEYEWAPVISAVGDFSGLVASIVDLTDNEYNTPFGWIGGILDLGNDATDLTTGIIGGGTYSEAGLWGVFAKTLFTYYSQCALSADEHLADGEWDIMHDTPAVACDGAVCALCAMIEGLSLGLISEKTTGVSGKEISQDLQDWAASVGKAIGYVILGDSESAFNEDIKAIYKLAEVVSLGKISEENTGVSADEVSNNIKNWAAKTGKDIGQWLLNNNLAQYWPFK